MNVIPQTYPLYVQWHGAGEDQTYRVIGWQYLEDAIGKGWGGYRPIVVAHGRPTSDADVLPGDDSFTVLDHP